MTKLIPCCFILILMAGCASHTQEPPQDRQVAASTKALGEAYMAQGNYIAALRELLNAEKKLPKDPSLQYDLGLVYLAREKYGLAESRFKKAISMKKNYTAAKNSLGVVFLKQRKWDAAISMFREISEDLLYATPHYPLSNMGWAYLGKGDYMGAQANFKRALKAKPDFINAIHGLATTYLAGGQPQRSRQVLDKAVSKYPDSPVLYSDLARTLEMMGEFTAAKTSWQQVIRLAPDSGLADEARKQLE